MNHLPITIELEKTVFPEDGERLYVLLDHLFSKGYEATVDFTDSPLVTHMFLNTSIGQLYHNYSSWFLKNHLFFKLRNDDIELISEVIQNAKRYFKEKETNDYPN